MTPARRWGRSRVVVQQSPSPSPPVAVAEPPQRETQPLTPEQRLRARTRWRLAIWKVLKNRAEEIRVLRQFERNQVLNEYFEAQNDSRKAG